MPRVMNQRSFLFRALPLRLLPLVLLTLAGCTSSDDDVADTFSDLSAPYVVRRDQAQGSIEEPGLITLPFSLPRDVDSFQIVARCVGCALAIDSVRDPRGDVIYFASDPRTAYLTQAGIQQSRVTTLNMPIFPRDAGFVSGQYAVVVRTFSGPADVTLDLAYKTDYPAGDGIITLNLVYAGSVGSTPDTLDAVDDAIQISRNILADHGFRLNVNKYYLQELGGFLPDPYIGDPVYEEIGEVLGQGVPLYLASQVSIRKPSVSNEFVFAAPASNPGPLMPTVRSAVVVNISQAAGPDGEFNGRGNDSTDGSEKDTDRDDEIRRLAENMINASLKYLGMRDTVQFSGSDVVATDGLTTTTCITQRGCEDEERVRENLLYPYPVEGNDREDGRFLFDRYNLEAEQKQLLMRQVGVN